jgi:hypothetical protein
MQKSLIYALLGVVPYSQAKFGFGPCKDSMITEGRGSLAESLFEGDWWIVKKDITLSNFQGQQCIESNYGSTNTGFDLTRNYDYKLRNGQGFDTAVVAMNNEGVGEAEWDTFLTPSRQHNIIATDYYNYAVVYGCDNYLFGLTHIQWALLLSRTKKLESKYVEEAFNALKPLGYEGVTEMKEDSNCGFDVGATPQGMIIN